MKPKTPIRDAADTFNDALTKMTHVEFDASFVGRPGDPRDKAAESIVHMYEGTVTGAGTFLPTSTRDLQIRCPRIHARPLKEALRKAGLTIEGENNEA